MNINKDLNKGTLHKVSESAEQKSSVLSFRLRCSCIAQLHAILLDILHKTLLLHRAQLHASSKMTPHFGIGKMIDSTFCLAFLLRCVTQPDKSCDQALGLDQVKPPGTSTSL